MGYGVNVHTDNTFYLEEIEKYYTNFVIAESSIDEDFCNVYKPLFESNDIEELTRNYEKLREEYGEVVIISCKRHSK